MSAGAGSDLGELRFPEAGEPARTPVVVPPDAEAGPAEIVVGVGRARIEAAAPEGCSAGPAIRLPR
jgi:hypothetical protein